MECIYSGTSRSCLSGREVDEAAELVNRMGMEVSLEIGTAPEDFLRIENKKFVDSLEEVEQGDSSTRYEVGENMNVDGVETVYDIIPENCATCSNTVLFYRLSLNTVLL